MKVALFFPIRPSCPGPYYDLNPVFGQIAAPEGTVIFLLRVLLEFKYGEERVKIALDGTPLTVATGGIRRYTEDVARALASTYPNDSVYLLCDRPVNLPPDSPPNLLAGECAGNAAERRWWLWGVRREMLRLGIDVFHGTDFSVPYLPRTPAVMTIHDLSPWRDDTAAQTSGRVRRRTPVMLRLGLATMIITPTEVIRNAAIERFRLAPDRVVAIPHAAAPWFRPAGVPGPRYFLFVGTAGARKNIAVIIEAWRELRKYSDVELWIAGRGLPDAPSDSAGLRWLGPVPDEQLPQLYSGASAVLCPSTYEGFGLPVLEAMQCGAPVITSRDPALHEVAGGASMEVDASDVRGWADAMQAMLTEAARAEWSAKSLRRAADFSWERTARCTHAVYEEAIRRFNA